MLLEDTRDVGLRPPERLDDVVRATARAVLGPGCAFLLHVRAVDLIEQHLPRKPVKVRGTQRHVHEVDQRIGDTLLVVRGVRDRQLLEFLLEEP